MSRAEYDRIQETASMREAARLFREYMELQAAGDLEAAAHAKEDAKTLLHPMRRAYGEVN